VVDASTIVSAALKADSVPMRALLAARQRGTLALSQEVLDEVGDVLSRPKFAKYISADRRAEILELLVAAAVWVETVDRVGDCRDAKDNKYLELGLAAGAEVIISSDEDLLVLHPWRGIHVLRPAAFLAEVV
jgi:putative PIN family toxin of toxin-antitoxin system